MTDNKKYVAVAVVIAIIAIVIFIYLFLIKKRVAPSCPEGTDIYMHMEIFSENPNYIKMAWYDHVHGRNLTATLIKSREIGLIMIILNEYLSDGRILKIQYECAIWQYDILVPPEV